MRVSAGVKSENKKKAGGITLAFFLRVIFKGVRLMPLYSAKEDNHQGKQNRDENDWDATAGGATYFSLATGTGCRNPCST